MHQTLLLEIQSYKDIVKCVLLLGVQVPLQYIVTSRPSDITLDCVLVKNTLNLIDKKIIGWGHLSPPSSPPKA